MERKPTEQAQKQPTNNRTAEEKQWEGGITVTVGGEAKEVDGCVEDDGDGAGGGWEGARQRLAVDWESSALA